MLQENDTTPGCWYYERGLCRNGSGCVFKHEGNIPQNKKLKLEIPGKEPDDDDVYTAVKVGLAATASFETDDELVKTRFRIAKYARDCMEGLENQSGPTEKLVNEYVDNFLGKIFQGYGDRPWISQVDLLLMLDAGVKELLPREVLEQEDPVDLERLVFGAHDRALDEQRSLPTVWETVQSLLQGPKTRSKVYKALEAGRKAAAVEEILGAEDFARHWISSAMRLLKADTQGYPEGVLTKDVAVNVFSMIFEGGGLPEAHVAEGGVPETGWHSWITEVLDAEYGAGAAKLKKVSVTRATYGAPPPSL